MADKKTTALKKRHAQEIAIRERRKRVHARLQQHRTLRDIAQELNISVETVLQDKKAIAKSLAKEHVDIKAIDLDDLDTMEQEAIEHFRAWAFRADELWNLVADEGPSKTLESAMKNAGVWWQKRLEVKRLKGKWLGYEVVEKAPEPITQDNRSITYINVNGVQQEVRPGNLRETMDAALGQLSPELLALVRGVVIDADTND